MFRPRTAISSNNWRSRRRRLMIFVCFAWLREGIDGGRGGPAVGLRRSGFPADNPLHEKRNAAQRWWKPDWRSRPRLPSKIGLFPCGKFRRPVERSGDPGKKVTPTFLGRRNGIALISGLDWHERKERRRVGIISTPLSA